MVKDKQKKISQRPARSVQADEKELWAEVMDDVAPLPDRPPPPPEEKKTARPSAGPGAGKSAQPVPARRPRSAPSLPPSGALPDLDPGHASGMDKGTANRLRRGKTDMDARLDLHGMTQDQAHRALDSFLARATAADYRTVLVITGKGRTQGGSGEGVLKTAVPRWLNEAPNRQRILGFFHAVPKDGGEGALYVRLKRKRMGS